MKKINEFFDNIPNNYNYIILDLLIISITIRQLVKIPYCLRILKFLLLFYNPRIRFFESSVGWVLQIHGKSKQY